MAELQLTSIATDDVAAVRVEYGGFVATGSAKRHPKDTPNKYLGEKLALARALATLSEKLQTQVDNQITLADSWCTTSTGGGFFKALTFPYYDYSAGSTLFPKLGGN